ncbi:hypothetical protein IFM89_010372 [Coptis chinensis]|uniref:Uncharacterized protein n=1 Tax=Coptis chinensis TaxID=261450 RepID=A0A835HSA2_9MAGN|nr:hypothetical protein IFM89_010372 [Coptis chinensis]
MPKENSLLQEIGQFRRNEEMKKPKNKRVSSLRKGSEDGMLPFIPGMGNAAKSISMEAFALTFSAKEILLLLASDDPLRAFPPNLSAY